MKFTTQDKSSPIEYCNGCRKHCEIGYTRGSFGNGVHVLPAVNDIAVERFTGERSKEISTGLVIEKYSNYCGMKQEDIAVILARQAARMCPNQKTR